MKTTYTGDGDGGIAEKEELIYALHTVHVSGFACQSGEIAQEERLYDYYIPK
jgi:hypothetical protein